MNTASVVERFLQNHCCSSWFMMHLSNLIFRMRVNSLRMEHSKVIPTRVVEIFLVTFLNKSITMLWCPSFSYGISITLKNIIGYFKVFCSFFNFFYVCFYYLVVLYIRVKKCSSYKFSKYSLHSPNFMLVWTFIGVLSFWDIYFPSAPL